MQHRNLGVNAFFEIEVAVTDFRLSFSDRHSAAGGPGSVLSGRWFMKANPNLRSARKRASLRFGFATTHTTHHVQDL